jgi:hypothetical protein
MIQNLNPPQFGVEYEFAGVEGAAPGVASANASCSRCDSSSRSGASGKSSSSARCGVRA